MSPACLTRNGLRGPKACCGRTAPTRTDPGTNTPVRSLGPRIVPPSIHPRYGPDAFPPGVGAIRDRTLPRDLVATSPEFRPLMRFAMICGFPTTSAVSSWLIAGGVTCGLA